MRGWWPRLYLAVQSLSIIVWWTTLALLPSTREIFAPVAVGGWNWLLWFLPADCITVIGGALAARFWHAYAGRLGLVLCLIGISTQTLASLTVPFRTAATGTSLGWLGATMMLLASLGTLACAGQMLSESQAARGIFRAAPAHWTRGDLARRTLYQSAVLWPMFFIVLPWALCRIERAAGWQPSPDADWIAVRIMLGGALFVGAGMVNLATARAMIRDGAGTPLPICMANRLATRGPYAVVRNPMCMSALAQGLGVAILIASPLTAAYVVLGGIVWHVLIRPSEERDLTSRFGQAYVDYQQQVRCWWPRFRRINKEPGGAQL
jgi:protein-S-isoprenylcysteine O-methyltransferase Ste14